MIISKTPLRVSLFGGGTDYPEYFERKRGAVLGGTINKYIYTSISKLSPISREHYRVQYRQVESCVTVEDIMHPVVREVLRLHSDLKHINISTVSDLPGGTGLGSSSAFTVGLLQAIYKMKGLETSKSMLARAAIDIERTKLQEKVGVQDQYHASFGGFSRYEYSHEAVQITPIETDRPTFRSLNKSVLLVYTGGIRRASDVTVEQVKKTSKSENDFALDKMYEFVLEATAIINSIHSDQLEQIGSLLSESWELKKSLSPSVTNTHIDHMVEVGLSRGAVGAKLLGAGGNGFVLFIIPQQCRQDLIDIFGYTNCIPFSFVPHGTELIHA